MSLYKRREKFNGLSIKVGTLFAKVGMSPNQWTLLTLIPAIIAAYMLTLDQFIVSAILFIIAAFIDMIDGAVARVTGKASLFGAYLDTLIDRYVEAIIIFGLLLASLPSLNYAGISISATIWIFIYFFGSTMTTYAKAAAKEKGLVEKELNGGILERADRLILLFVGMVLAQFDPFFLTFIIAVLAILSNVTVIQRIRIASKMRMA